MFPSKLFLDDVFDEKNKMKCDIYEKENTFYIVADMPGFSKEDISIELNQDNITITAESKETNESKNYICRERYYGKYQRTFYLGDIEEDQVKASFTNGILNIAIPKQSNQNTKKIIEIN